MGPSSQSQPLSESLAQNRIFAGLPESVLEEIVAGLDTHCFQPEERVFEEGEPGDCLYLVCHGSVRISKAGRGGRQETLGFIGTGDFFGEMALIDGQPRSAQATAAETCLLARVDHGTFDRILASAPRELHSNFLRRVVERLRGLNSHYITELMRSERLSLVGSMANSIVHDLKSPLQAIQSCAELITIKSPDPAIGNFVGIIHKAVENMVDMTQELLDFARGQTSLEPLPALPALVVAEVDSAIQQLVPPGIHLLREIRPTGEVMVDTGRFARMLVNLIKNAIESMPRGGVLGLRVEERAGQVIFTVRDTGCGIEPELQARIFEPFVTFGKSQGTGLGMAIAKSVVEAHQGTITLTSRVGVGTTVEVSLPRFVAVS